MQQKRKRMFESANVGAVRSLMVVLAALVVLSVSGYGTVIYIQLMGKVFPTGPLQMACYMGAAANLLLMLVLLVGKFVWFRPGAHEVASWLVTGVELVVVILNMILSYQLASGQPLQSFMAAWYYLAPVSPVFSMIGAIALIMTSSELRKKHHDLEIEERKDRAESEFGMAMHEAEMEVKTQYLGFVKTNLVQELNAPERQIEMKNHAKVLVSQVLSGLSGVSSVPLLSPGTSSALPAPKDVELETDTDDEWLARVNARVEAERRQRLTHMPDEQLSEAEQAAKWRAIHEEAAEQVARSERLGERLARSEQARLAQARRRVAEEEAQDEEPSSVEYRARRPGQS